MKKATLLSLLLLISACTHSTATHTAQKTFFNSLSSLCGLQYIGEMTFPVDGQDSFKGKTLVADFKECSNDEIRIPFSVGDDKSRTWIISKFENSLELKHDHRHEDGSPDEINFYGGQTKNLGSHNKQSFYADTHTAKMIPEASTNVWTISLNEQKTELTYHLERHNKSRFTAILFLNPE